MIKNIHALLWSNSLALRNKTEAVGVRYCIPALGLHGNTRAHVLRAPGNIYKVFSAALLRTAKPQK